MSVKSGVAPSHPGEIVREFIDDMHLTIAAAARVLRVRRATLSDLVNGKTGLSPEMALRIEKGFGMNMDTMLRMQAGYDAYAMRQRANEIDVQRYVPAVA